MRGDQVENYFESGDDFAFSEKAIPHRKSLFPVTLEPGETKNYYVEMESDGEVISLPFKVDEKISFYEKDYFHQFGHGFYYGILLLIIIIYFFFFVMLKNRAFLYYILYVLFLGLLQFSLDGYSFQYFFPSGGYLANHFVLFSAAFTVVFLIFYVDNFLNLSERNLLMKKVFRSFQFLVIGVFAISIIPGRPYEISFPVINGVSLIAIILTVVAIYRLKLTGRSVCNFFTAAFTILIVGAVIFILGNFNIVGNADISQSALKISSALEVIILSISMSNKYRDLQKQKEVAQAEALKNLEEKNALMDEINVKLEAQVKERTAEIEAQKEQLAEYNEEILSSIKYAKRIQEAILPSQQHVAELLGEHFVLYLPKDVVSGDFYFVEKTHTSTKDATPLILFAAVDCTGHGVPGAFMSIVGNNYLNQSLTESTVNSPAEALDFLNYGVNKALRQHSSANTVRDGMDIALCALNPESKLLYFSGAKNPLYIVRKINGDIDGFELEYKYFNTLVSDDGKFGLIEIKGDSHPIGAYVGDGLKPFTNKSIQLQEDDLVYVFTDGYADQFGGESGKKYKYKNFKRFLLSIADSPANQQGDSLLQEFEAWKGTYEQLDDVCIIGVRV